MVLVNEHHRDVNKIEEAPFKKNSINVLSEKHFYSAYSLSVRGYKEGTVICILTHDGVLCWIYCRIEYILILSI